MTLPNEVEKFGSLFATDFRGLSISPDRLFTRRSLSGLLFPLTAALILVLIICGALYLREAAQIQSNMLDRESRRTEILANLFGNDVNSAVDELRLLATGDALQSYLSTGQPADLARATHRALFFSNDNPDFDQVRFLDPRGQEVIRINAHGVVVPPGQLQNKQDRPYFQKAWSLSPGQVYISKIDLNMERGAVEIPIKPTFRVAMPVFDGNGVKRGVYVINYLMGNTLQRLRDFVPQYQHRFRLLNAQGYWLAGPQPEDEWGFMLPRTSGQTLAQRDPALWNQIVHNQSGQIPHDGGYFTWYRFSPQEISGSKTVQLVPGDEFLVFASQISPAEWASGFASLRQTFVMVAALVMILATVMTWFFHARGRAQRERDRFFNVTRDMLCVAGFDGFFKRVNPAWEKALGFTSKEMITKPFVDFVHPDDREKTIAAMSDLTRGQEIISFENRYRCKDGTYRWLLWSARPLLEEQVIYGSARDLTDRKQIEESLRQNEEWSRSIIASAHDAFVSIDAAGRVRDWNAEAERTFGWSREEVLGHYLHETIIPPKYREAHVRGMQHLQKTGEGPVLNKTLELTALRKNGEEFPVEIVIWPLQMGQKTSFHAFIRDITVRQQAAERIQSLNIELKDRADLLETANKELESFSYSVSHDLRAPLRHIHGFVELLQQLPAIQENDSGQRYMGVIARAAKEMGRLIDDLLAFSRTGRAEMHPVNIDMREMVDQVIQLCAPECKDRHVEWDIKPLPTVPGDPRLLRLVWTNLVENALKYTRPREQTKIEIGQLAGKDDASKDREAVFYVRDNGVGFEMQYSSKLFGVFQRLHRAEEFEGTGIGLANVQRIIHRHGGRVWADSQVDCGATFYFTLPWTGAQLSAQA
jgi:PAS domain S-box-containing protein